MSAEWMLLASSAAEPAFSELGGFGETEVPPMGRAPGQGGPTSPGSGGNQLVSHIFECWVSDEDIWGAWLAQFIRFLQLL